MRNQAGNQLRQTRWRPLTSKRRCHAIFDKRKSPNTPFGTGEGLALTQKWRVVSPLGLWRFGWLKQRNEILGQIQAIGKLWFRPGRVRPGLRVRNRGRTWQ